MACTDRGDVVVFSYPKGATETSSMVGTLTYRDGRYVRDPKGDSTQWSKQEETREAALRDDSMFDSKSGYVCRAAALNTRFRPTTVLRTSQQVLVSFGNDGLAWATAADLASQPALDVATEWEPITDVTAVPTLDPNGNLWVGRGNKLLVYSKEKTTEIPGDLAPEQELTIDFDQLGRAWIARWHGSTEGEVSVAGTEGITQYGNYTEALKAEAPKFKPGRILPWAVKTPNGAIASGCGYFQDFLIIDREGEHRFEPSNINPQEQEIAEHASHGYNPFRHCWPWYDKAGRIYAKVNELPFCYVNGKWIAANNDAENESAIALNSPKEEGDIAAPFETEVKSADGRVFIFRGFHFYEKTHLLQIDSQLNPLAYYPFWTSWWSSPGQTRPVIAPDHRIWISPKGPYSNYREWFVLRSPAS
jgi:hypothetical protein